VNSVKKILDAAAVLTVTKPKCGPKLLINAPMVQILCYYGFNTILLLRTE